jgi:hypothetical protein
MVPNKSPHIFAALVKVFLINDLPGFWRAQTRETRNNDLQFVKNMLEETCGGGRTIRDRNYDRS